MLMAEHQTPHGVWLGLTELLIEVQDVAHPGVTMVHEGQSSQGSRYMVHVYMGVHLCN